MKLVELALALVLVTPVAAMGQGDMKGMDMKGDMKGMNQKSMPMETKDQTTYKAKGTVKAIDKTKGTVTLAHGPVKELKWSAMTMTFGVKDKSMLDKLSAGNNVEVEFVRQDKGYVITGMK